MKKSLIYLLFVLLFTQCTRDNYLDFVPKGVLIPTTIDDYRNILDQITPIEDDISFSSGFGEMHVRPFFYTDDAFLSEEISSGRGYSAEMNRAFIFSENHVTQVEEDPEWAAYYNQIYVANVVIDGVEQLETADTDAKEALIADARLQRAYAYLHLVNIYSLHYDPVTATTNMGVPIREGIELTNVDLTRASVQEVYDYILNDINESIASLPEIQPVGTRFRPSQMAAYALLARVYLYQGKYTEALDASKNALDIYDDLANYNNLLNTDNVYTIPDNILDDNQLILYKYYDFFKADALFVSDELYNLYDDDDIRKTWFSSWEEQFPGEDLGTVKSAFWTSSQPNIGLSTPELLLIQAECHSRAGNTTEALEHINRLRSHRYISGTYQDVDISDPAALLDFIKEERRRELVPNHLRLFDIKRYNTFDNANISVTHELEGEEVTLSPNSMNWAFPIAEKYINLNPEILQNPRD